MSGELIKRSVIRGQLTQMTGLAEGMCGSLASESIPIGSTIFNFDPTKPENFGLIDLIDDPATREHEQHAEEPFMLMYWSCKKIMLAASADQPERPAVRTVLISGDGETLDFVSKGILSSLDSIRLRYGDGPYDPALPIIVRIVKLPNKFKMAKISVTAPPAGEPPKK